MIPSAVLALALCTACANEMAPTERTPDGLRLVRHSDAQRAWVKPGEDFSQYTRVMLIDCLVSFRKDWKTNYPGLRAPDMERFKKQLADDFRAVFSEELQKGGYPIATKADDDVLQVRPALINLEVSAPNTLGAADAISFTASVENMALYVELFDSVSNAILARAIDERVGRNLGDTVWTAEAGSRDQARRMFKRWADLLVEKLDEFHGKKSG